MMSFWEAVIRFAIAVIAVVLVAILLFEGLRAIGKLGGK